MAQEPATIAHASADASHVRKKGLDIFSKQTAVSSQGSHQPSLERPLVASGIPWTRAWDSEWRFKFSTSKESWELSRMPGGEINCLRPQSQVQSPSVSTSQADTHEPSWEGLGPASFLVSSSSVLPHCPASPTVPWTQDAGLCDCLASAVH